MRAVGEVGVGVCPKNAGGHVWAGTDPAKGGDARNSCKFCRRPGRDNRDIGESGGYFAEATMARMELFDGLKAPASSHGKAKTS